MDEKTAKLMETNKKIILKNEKKIVSGDKSKANFLSLAKAQGCEGEAIQLFNKYETLLYNCTDPVERKHIVVTGLKELYKLVNARGGLTVDGVVVIPDEGQ